MYLEQRIEQLEHISLDQGKQIEITAGGLATLTTQVQIGFSDVRDELTNLNDRVDHLEDRFDKLEMRFDKLEARLDQIDIKIDQLDAKIDAIDQKMDLRFDALFALINSKLS